MPLYNRKDVLLAKKEVTYGVDPTPTGAANAILVSNLNVIPMEQRLVPRELIRSYFGNSEQLPAELHGIVEFDVEWQSSGAAGTAPKFGPLLQACGFAETVTPATRVVYDLKTDEADIGSVTMWAYKDSVVHKLTGARGTVRLVLDNQEIPKLRFRLMGVYSTPTDLSPSGVSYTGWVKPKLINATNTTLTLHSVTPVLAAMELDLNNSIVYRDFVGGTKRVVLAGREAQGSMTIEAVTVATKNWFSTVENATTGALAVTHGSGGGGVAKVDAPGVQIVQPSYGDIDGITTLEASLVLVPSSGNDELKLTFE